MSQMKRQLRSAMNVLVKEVKFLGYKNVGELIVDLERSPGSFKLSTVAAYKTYQELAYV